MPSDWMLIFFLSHMLMFALNISVGYLDLSDHPASQRSKGQLQKAEVDVQMTCLFFVQVKFFRCSLILLMFVYVNLIK